MATCTGPSKGWPALGRPLHRLPRGRRRDVLWTLLLFVRGPRAIAHPPEPPPEGADGFTWVFLVPALNEEVTIADSVERLLALPVARKRIVVIDDASDDRTPEILAAIDHPDLLVLRRELPDAQMGKAAGLNYAYRALRGYVDRERVDRRDRRRRRPPRPRRAALRRRPLRRPRGGRRPVARADLQPPTPLIWMQDVEFAVYGHLFQAGRNDWGTAGMGGNGQFNRLSALDAVADDVGPWRDRLTEDQDLGLRLIAAGWKGRQDLRAVVDQQGLPKLRPLLRQRTRWSQGNLQAIGAAGARCWATRRSGSARDRADGLPLHAVLAGDHRPRPGRRGRCSRSSASPRSGAAARPGSWSSSTCSPSAARRSAASPRARQGPIGWCLAS